MIKEYILPDGKVVEQLVHYPPPETLMINNQLATLIKISVPACMNRTWAQQAIEQGKRRGASLQRGD